jgi:thioredoxin reductase (NADPH)
MSVGSIATGFLTTAETPAADIRLTPGDRLRLVDHLSSPEAHDLRVFLTRNGVPYEWVDLDYHPLGRLLVESDGLAGARFPVCLFPDGTRLEAPSRYALARKVGLHTRPSQPVYDVAIIGGGPAGLTAAVYAASEGLRTIVIERDSPGGQAGTSSRIENYPGFPQGISGQELTDRALEQAERFGAELVVANEVVTADPLARAPFRVSLLDGSELRSHTAIVATGVAYRLLDAPGIADLTGKGVCYGAGVAEAPLYRGLDLFVAGGANSAGQAALYFAQFARHVTLLVRGASLTESMSDYLIKQLAGVENITIQYRTEVAAAVGTTRLEALRLRNLDTGAETYRPADGLAILIGHKPATGWAQGLLKRDAQGFILTGDDLLGTPGRRGRRSRRPWWSLARDPLFLETSVPGVFVAGDVRHGSTKRVASAVGEGAMAVQLVHRYLGEFAAADVKALDGAGLPPPLATNEPLLHWQPGHTAA